MEKNISIIQYFAQLGQVAARGNLSDRRKYDRDITEFHRLYTTYKTELTEGDYQNLLDWCAERNIYAYAEQWHNGTQWLAMDLMAKWLKGEAKQQYEERAIK